MKVHCCKEIYVQLEADVSFDEMLVELGVQVDEGGKYPGRLTATLDLLTRILARVDDKWIAAMKRTCRDELFKRLFAQAQRYATV